MNSANLVCLSFLFGINSVAVAQQSDADSLFSLSFEQLMQVEVSLAAKKSETWLNSSGTVYVVSRDEISNYGWRDLKEILASIPNMDYFYQWSWLPGGQRGFTGNMSGTLMLIDGREVQNLLANEAFIMNNFPASRIERVEILQGPNSTLYGGNATQGVINVITRLGSDGNEISLLAGEVSTRHGNLLLNHQQGDLSLAMNVSYFQSAQDYRELQEFVFDTQAFSRSPKDGLRDLSEQRFRNDETNYTIDAKVQYQRSYAGMNISRSENVSGIEAVAYDYITGDDSRRGYALYYLGQTFAPNEKLSGTVELSYFREYKEKDRLTAIIPDAAQSYQDITLYNEREDIGPSDRLRLSTQWQYRLNDNSDWIVGYDGWKTEIGRKIKYRDSATGTTLFTPAEWAQDKEKSEKHALYGQYSKTFKWQQESLKVSAGLRYNQQDFTDSAYLPRASLVYQPDPIRPLSSPMAKRFGRPLYSNLIWW
ncbi:TonB-dependent receptor plug domain-containing protein [Pseudoalteromonas 'SMAR']|uniref:TonB-dependent receptor plug domain-containing protein n=1 Tax=Pseudoalteromonas 'SMAR' TaxID=3416908 RepID=UPI003AF2FA64